MKTQQNLFMYEYGFNKSYTMYNLVLNEHNDFFKDNSQNAPLVGSTLETLLRFLNWIPLGYIFETKLITTLIYKVTYLYKWLYMSAKAGRYKAEYLKHIMVRLKYREKENVYCLLKIFIDIAWILIPMSLLSR